MTLPYNIVNGQAIDATPVMANFNSLDGRLPGSGAVAAQSGANADITSLTGLTTPLPIVEGGTGATTAAAAQAAINAAPVPVAQGGTGDAGTAWTNTTGLTVTSGSGTLTTASASVRWKKIGKTLFYTLSVGITTVGTGAGAINIAGLPWTTGPTTQMGAGREVNVNGKMFSATFVNGASTAALSNYDNSSPIVASGSYIVSGVLETA